MKKRSLTRLTLALMVAMLALSCIQSPRSGKRTSSFGSTNSNGSLGFGQGRYLKDNPIIISGNEKLPGNTDMSTVMERQPIAVPSDDNLFLTKSCNKGTSTEVASCLQVKEDRNSEYLNSVESRWGFEPNTEEFLQVNAFVHMSKAIDQFQANLNTIYYSWALPGSSPGFRYYHTSIPYQLYSSNAHWFYDPTKVFAEDRTRPLNVYSRGFEGINAEFSPSSYHLAFGTYPETYGGQDTSNVKFAQDPTVMYHELGHGLSHILLNMRNTAASQTMSANLGYLGYDEAGIISEALADFFSYYVTKRTHMGEWALGRFAEASRPLTEDDPLHVAALSSTRDGRLSYPDWLLYDPNTVEPSEDIHNAGMVISHYVVALVQDLMSTCGKSEDNAIKDVLHILAETLGELGDLTAKGGDYRSEGYVNLNSNHALTWLKIANPITTPKFAQTFAKYLYTIFSSRTTIESDLATAVPYSIPTRCNGTEYPKDRIEQLLDDYGLLLFYTYNEDGNGATTGHSGVHTKVATENRKKSVLISKNNIDIVTKINNLPEGISKNQFSILDDRKEMIEIMANLQSSGTIYNLSEQIQSDLPYNNGNLKFSPGEVVGIALNLYNKSNSPMSGIQILANDWDHFKNGKPCNTFEDQFPIDGAGAADSSAEAAPSTTPGDCNYITRDNGDESAETLYPTCIALQTEDDATMWTNQEEYMDAHGIPKEKCLGRDYDDNSVGNPKECFLRVIPGKDNAVFAKINPGSNWTNTVKRSDGKSKLYYNHVLLFEVNSWTPPGSTFMCRFRVRFSNCSDCFYDSSKNYDNYLDYEYSGAPPFKIIDVRINVTD